MQTHRVVVVVLGGFGDGTGDVDAQPAVQEGTDRQPIIGHDPGIDLLAQLPELLDCLGPGTPRYFLMDPAAVGVVAE